MSILDDAKALARRICDSAEYAEYASAKAVIDQNPEQARLLRDYSTLLLSYGTGDETPEAALARKKRESSAYYAVEANNDAKRFLDAERAIVDLLCGVIDILTKECPIDLSLLDKDGFE